MQSIPIDYFDKQQTFYLVDRLPTVKFHITQINKFHSESCIYAIPNRGWWGLMSQCITDSSSFGLSVPNSFDMLVFYNKNVLMVTSDLTPPDRLRNNGVVITSKRRHFDVITSKWRRFDVITTFLLRHVFSGTRQMVVIVPSSLLQFHRIYVIT